MSLRTRLTLAGGGAVFVALAIASLVIYVEVRSKLHDQIDFSLIQSADGVAAKSDGLALKSHSNAARSFGKDATGLFQVIPRVDAVANGGLSATGAPVATPQTVPRLDDPRLRGRTERDPLSRRVGGEGAVAPLFQGRSHGHGDAVVHDATACFE